MSVSQGQVFVLRKTPKVTRNSVSFSATRWLDARHGLLVGRLRPLLSRPEAAIIFKAASPFQGSCRRTIIVSEANGGAMSKDVRAGQGIQASWIVRIHDFQTRG